MKTISGTRLTVDLSNSLISMFTVQSCREYVEFALRDHPHLYLCVKRIKLELVDTLECFGVDLLECDSVLCPLEDVYLLHDVQPALCEVALPGDGHLGLVIPLGGLLVLCIGENNKGDPKLEFFYFFYY